MASILHLTNGSAIIPMMRAAGIDGPIVPWDDVLHEGPVPAGLNVAAMRDVRADFLAACGWESRNNLSRWLASRDAALDAAASGRPCDSVGQYIAQGDLPPHERVDEITLWFEHDLFDQLHLLQILDRLPMDGPPRLTAVPDDHYLGHLPTAEFERLFAARRDVTSAQRSAARDAWTAFRSADPRTLVDILPRVTVLPHLPAAMLRHLQQFPSRHNGLSRTEHQALAVMARGVTQVREIFVQSHIQAEEAFFMGDSAFVFHLTALLRAPRPLIRVRSEAAVLDPPLDTRQAPVRSTASLSIDAHIEPTEDGMRILEARADRVTSCGIDRWLGGVHLTGYGPTWRWDRIAHTLRFA